MFIKQIYTKCLAQASYYIESEGEVVIIDPIRDIDKYVNLIDGSKSKLKYILETHFHADFISGHLELAKKYSSPIIFGPNASPPYNIISKDDGDLIKIGNIKIKILHTPGHTLESVSYLLIDENEKEHAVFTGDTLFVGDVGIPDVAQRYENITKEELASILYDSLDKLMMLDDEVILYPGHGKGTQCGKNLSSDTFSTIGKQRKLNYALNFENKSKFIDSICSNIPNPPGYFLEAVNKNAKGYKDYDLIFERSHVAVDELKFLDLVKKNDCIVIDSRHPVEFAKKHLKGSVNIGLNGSFAISAGNLIDVNSDILIISNPGDENETIKRLLRVGFDNIIGFLDGSIDKLQDEHILDSIQQVKSENLDEKYNDYKVIDVRTKSEYKSSHLLNSINLPLYDIADKKNILNKDEKYLIHCQTGYRSMIASSLFKKMNFNVVEIKDGFKGILNSEKKDLIVY